MLPHDTMLTALKPGPGPSLLLPVYVKSPASDPAEALPAELVAFVFESCVPGPRHQHSPLEAVHSVAEDRSVELVSCLPQVAGDRALYSIPLGVARTEDNTQNHRMPLRAYKRMA
jgi:hypothetical protein